jgi:hypothetical protein
MKYWVQTRIEVEILDPEAVQQQAKYLYDKSGPFEEDPDDEPLDHTMRSNIAQALLFCAQPKAVLSDLGTVIKIDAENAWIRAMPEST